VASAWREPTGTVAILPLPVHEDWVGKPVRELEAATGSRVTVIDGGGVFGERDQIPPPDYKVVVQLDHTGHLSERQVQRFLEAELPLGSQVELDIRFPGEKRS